MKSLTCLETSLNITLQANLEWSLAKETLLTSEEAIIAAAAAASAQAVALVNVAIKVAKAEATMMVGQNNCT